MYQEASQKKNFFDELLVIMFQTQDNRYYMRNFLNTLDTVESSVESNWKPVLQVAPLLPTY